MAAESGSDIYADTLAVFEESGPAEPLTTPEVAERLDVTRQTFNHHLRAAEETIVRQFFERPATTRSD